MRNTCGACGVALTPLNARWFRGRWVGKCRPCESKAGSARYAARKAAARKASA